MNLNDRIKFKLTERGKRLVKSKQLIVTENPEGYCIMSLHAFCPEFGPYFVPQLGENFIEANNIEKVSDALR